MEVFRHRIDARQQKAGVAEAGDSYMSRLLLLLTGGKPGREPFGVAPDPTPLAFWEVQ